MILDKTRTCCRLMRKTLASSAGLFAALLVEIIVFGVLQQRFLSTATFTAVINQIPALTVVAVGMTIVLISGGIDLSVGSLLALTGSFVGILMVDHHLELATSIVVAVMASTVCGMLNGAYNCRVKTACVYRNPRDFADLAWRLFRDHQF